jgi:hypothetical protein
MGIAGAGLELGVLDIGGKGPIRNVPLADRPGQRAPWNRPQRPATRKEEGPNTASLIIQKPTAPRIRRPDRRSTIRDRIFAIMIHSPD